jgi:hypothetical protein
MFDLSQWKTWIITAPPQDFWIWCAVLGIAAALTGYGIFYFIRRARLIEDTPTAKIRSAAQGYLELIGIGKYLGDKPLLAPLTGTPCTWYSYKIERKVHSGKHTRWSTVESENSSLPFLLVDDTGQCLINPAGAEVIPAVDLVWYGHTRRPALTPARNAGGIFQISSGGYRYTEKRLHADEFLYALGDFVTLGKQQGERHLDWEVSATLKVWKQNPQALLQQFDADNNGEIDLQEWERVRAVARNKVLHNRLHNATTPVVHTLGKPRDSRPFILSVQSQRSMSRKFRFKAAASLTGFVLTGPLGVWMVLVRLTV